MDRPLSMIVIRAAPGVKNRGLAHIAGQTVPVALGRAGIATDKREGDGATPRGRFFPRRIWWRADRLPRPLTALPLRAITARDGWCEDPRHRLYNRPLRLGTDAAGDRLMRADHLYDLIVEIDHNTVPRIAHRGSAVFLHLARPALAPTAGCVGFTLPELRRLVARLGPATAIIIE